VQLSIPVFDLDHERHRTHALAFHTALVLFAIFVAELNSIAIQGFLGRSGMTLATRAPIFN
jgi:hypothetical protein